MKKGLFRFLLSWYKTNLKKNLLKIGRHCQSNTSIFFTELHFLQWKDILYNPGMKDLQKVNAPLLKISANGKLVSEYFVCYLSLFIEVPDQ